MKRVYLAGEGPNDLGAWARHPAYRASYGPGLIEALLERVAPGGFQVVGATMWKDVRHFRARPVRALGRGDTNTVGKLAFLARRAGAEVLIYVRDWDRVRARSSATAPREELAQQLAAAGRQGVQAVGGLAVRNIDAWCLALRGDRGSENESNPKARLEGLSVAATPEKVALVENADLDNIPADAVSLRAFLDAVRDALA